MFYFNMQPRLKWNKNVLDAKTFLFRFRRDVWNEINFNMEPRLNLNAYLHEMHRPHYIIVIDAIFLSVYYLMMRKKAANETFIHSTLTEYS